MFRVRLHIEYDGSPYSGWQIQNQGQKTVQGELTRALCKIFDDDIKVVSSSRTDTGVHALDQVVHFDVKRDPLSFEMVHAIQGHLPPSIVVKKAFLAPQDFHANRDAIKKTYKYVIRNSDTRDALKWNQSLFIRRPLDLNYLNSISQVLVGHHDFKSFQNSGTDVETTDRKIYEIKWALTAPGWIEFTITGNGFLKQMVRNIVGTLLAMENDRLPTSRLIEILSARNRQVAAKTAPPEGLYLVKVFYPAELDIKCREI